MLTSVIVWPYKLIYFQSFIICKNPVIIIIHVSTRPSPPRKVKLSWLGSVTGRPTHHQFPHRPPALLPNLLIWKHNYRPRRRTRRFFQVAPINSSVWAITCQNRSCVIIDSLCLLTALFGVEVEYNIYTTHKGRNEERPTGWGQVDVTLKAVGTFCLTLHVSRNSLSSCFLAQSIPGRACGDTVGTTEAPLKPTFLPQKRLYVTPPHLTNAIIRLL